jgi:hypothetical protein
MKAATGRIPMSRAIGETPRDGSTACAIPSAVATAKMIVHSFLLCLLAATKAAAGRRSASISAYTSATRAMIKSNQKK